MQWNDDASRKPDAAAGEFLVAMPCSRLHSDWRFIRVLLRKPVRDGRRGVTAFAAGSCRMGCRDNCAGAGAADPLRWLGYQVSYRVTREGIVYLAGIFIVALAALNTGNNLLFLVLGCLLAGILFSGVLSRIMLSGIEFNSNCRSTFLRGSRCWPWSSCLT